jgi:hypothetical protein
MSQSLAGRGRRHVEQSRRAGQRALALDGGKQDEVGSVNLH